MGKMKLIYRGISYEDNPTVIATVEGKVGGKFRGLDWRFHNLKKPPVLQPPVNLTYRGVTMKLSSYIKRYYLAVNYYYYFRDDFLNFNYSDLIENTSYFLNRLNLSQGEKQQLTVAISLKINQLYCCFWLGSTSIVLIMFNCLNELNNDLIFNCLIIVWSILFSGLLFVTIMLPIWTKIFILEFLRCFLRETRA